ncbi:Phenoxybenzoate dioxygenase subunit beta [Variovorax sp. SRS16]|nr:PDR/VanB family oxidoreductase [Variovorax sp. SRS16]VTU13187.1 Phenoxybenzoate dioxygenase subunit beta [Variovorax sp. SRS16]
MTSEVQSLRLSAIRYEAEAIASFQFQHPDAAPLPAFAPGAHVDVHLPNGLIRSYSLSNESSETHRYVVTVARDVNSRGGSAYMHDKLHVGQLLKVGVPANHFPLDESASDTVLIAGGVGVTPIWCMAQRLERLGRPVKVFYASRSRANAAFSKDFEALGRRHAACVHLHFDDERGLLDIRKLVSENVGAGTHVYCCGPTPMLQAFEAACSHLPPECVHVEYFKAKDAPITADGLELVLAKSQKTLRVGHGKTVLDAILEAGIDVPYSCMEGICGSCEVPVLDGVPDHHDSVLSAKQKASNSTMLICCSGAKSSRLVLDL